MPSAEAYRPFVVARQQAVLLDPDLDPARRDELLAQFFAQATPISDLRARDAYRTAMLPVLARRALGVAVSRMSTRQVRR